EAELKTATNDLPGLHNIAVKGLMGMASLTDNSGIIRTEFRYLKSLYDRFSSPAQTALHSSLTAHHLPLSTLSMGMSGDYRIAVEEGSTMVRIGSLLFGSRH
ncbi:MAG TPA: alanine racemase, partial [Agriterribacter sp.]|nr:alanine racemase [Agriterribacter sp.]